MGSGGREVRRCWIGRGAPGLKPKPARGGPEFPADSAPPVYAQFESAYRERYAESPRAVTGVTASYSAVYAFAFGLMASAEPLRYGDALALGLRQLTGGLVPLTTAPDAVSKLSEALAAQQAVTVTGTLGELGWTTQGSPRGALVGAYCLERVDNSYAYVSTGYRYNIASGALEGTPKPCAAAQDSATTSPARAADSGSKPRKPADMDAGTDASQPNTDAGQPAADSGAPHEEVATDIGLVAQYFPLNNQPFDSVVSPAIKILNRSSSEAISLCSLRARYYFSNEHPDACPQDCKVDGFYSGLQPSGMTTTAERSFHDASDASADNPSAYIEISFPCSRTALGQGESVEVQQQFHTDPYRDFDETNDYSFRAVPSSYADWDRVTLYHEGKLVWGKPPH